VVGVGRSAKNSESKGTTMKKSSQIQSVDATAFPERVSVVMGEIAENMQEGLLALAVGAGLEVMEADVTTLAGPKGKHNMTRTAVRHGGECGSVTLGGRRVPLTRPRVRAADGSGELPIASYELFTSTEILDKMAMEKMLAGLSTRRYPVGLEPVGPNITEKSSATSKSAVSRRFVAMTETALAELLSRDLSGLDLVALMIDGVHFAETCCIVVLGIDIEGNKHPLALVEGSTENATLVTGLLVGLRERGLDVTRPMLVGLDGSKALRKAVVDVLDRPVIQGCQLHKIRHAKDHLPQRLRASVGRKMLPVGDKPVIEHTVRELVSSSITDITIVVSGGKSLIQEHFRPNPVLVEQLRADGKTAYADAVEEVGELSHRGHITYLDRTAPTATAHLCSTRPVRSATSRYSYYGPTTSSSPKSLGHNNSSAHTSKLRVRFSR
jgi:transposase-like protein